FRLHIPKPTWRKQNALFLIVLVSYSAINNHEKTVYHILRPYYLRPYGIDLVGLPPGKDDAEQPGDDRWRRLYFYYCFFSRRHLAPSFYHTRAKAARTKKEFPALGYA